MTQSYSTAGTAMDVFVLSGRNRAFAFSRDGLNWTERQSDQFLNFSHLVTSEGHLYGFGSGLILQMEVIDPPKFSGLSFREPRSGVISLVCTPEVSYRIETSSNLAIWTLVTNVIPAASGLDIPFEMGDNDVGIFRAVEEPSPK